MAGAELNPFVMDVLQEYPVDGSYGYHWPKPGTSKWEGTTRDVVYAGQRLCSGDPQRRSFCCGLTFEVYVEALLRANQGSPAEGVSPTTCTSFASGSSGTRQRGNEDVWSSSGSSPWGWAG